MEIEEAIQSHPDVNAHNAQSIFGSLFLDFYSPIRIYIGSFITCFIGLSIVSFLHFEVSSSQYTEISKISETNGIDTGDVPSGIPPFLVASGGAMAILVFGQIDSPLAQPRNAFFGQIISAIVGVTVRQIFYYSKATRLVWLQSSLAVSIALVAMQLTGTVHPPGGATALVAVTGGPAVYSLGYWYVLMPVGTTSVILILTAVLLHQPLFGRPYPLYWWSKTKG